jgi:hypothetical protein
VETRGKYVPSTHVPTEVLEYYIPYWPGRSFPSYANTCCIYLPLYLFMYWYYNLFNDATISLGYAAANC